MRAVTRAMHKLGLSKTKEELRNMAMAAFHVRSNSSGPGSKAGMGPRGPGRR